MIGSLFTSIANYGKALSFISKHRLWGFMLLPVLMNMVMLFAVGWLAWSYNDDLSLFIYEWLMPADVDESVSKWLKIATQAVVWIVTIFFYVKVYKYLLLIMLSPFLSLLANKTLEILHGTSAPFQWRAFIGDVIRGIAVTMQSLLMEVGLGILLFALSFIPIFSPVTAVAFLLVEWFFLGASMLDYYNEFEGRSASQSWRFCWQHKGATFGTGLGMYLSMLIPFAIFIAPMLAVVAGCLTGFGIGQKKR